MRGKTASITLSAAFAALAVAFMYIASVFPTGKVGFVAASSLFVAAAVVETGIKGGAMVYVVSAVLSFLVVPMKESAVFFTAFFGYYPVVKSIAEKMKSRVLEWIIKICVMNGALSILIFAFGEMFFDFSGISFALPIVYLAVNVLFPMFDIGLSGIIAFYNVKIHSKIRR